jgi:hypothetical protein
VTAPRTERKNGGMPRWGVNRRYWVRVGDEPFLDRRVLVICPQFAVLLTDIYGPDAGRDPHDHSRAFTSLILSGSYAEDVYCDPGDLRKVTRRHHRRWSVHRMPAGRAHGITSVPGGTARTLVLAGRSRGTWSFWTPRGKVGWKAYDSAETGGGGA